MRSKILAKWVPGPGICTCKESHTKNSTTKNKHLFHKIDGEKILTTKVRVGYPTLSGGTTEEKKLFYVSSQMPKGVSP